MPTSHQSLISRLLLLERNNILFILFHPTMVIHSLFHHYFVLKMSLDYARLMISCFLKCGPYLYEEVEERITQLEQ